MKCIIVDDETPALDILEDNISQVPFLHLVKRCKNAYEAIEALQDEHIDLMFLDIQMPGISGANFLRSLPVKPIVIFITAYKKFAVEGFDLDVLDYLVKPVPFNRFLKAVNKALEYHSFKTKETGAGITAGIPDYLFIHTEYRLVKVFIHEITYIEGLKNYIKIYLSSADKPILARLSFKAIEEKLPPGKYARVHKSFIVFIDKISFIRRDHIQIGKAEIPISKFYKGDFLIMINGRNIKDE